MKIIAVAGGIGTGKSVVSRILESYSIPVYNSDIRAKHLMHSDVGLVRRIKEIFGEEAYEDGLLNRSYISRLAFGNSELLQALNAAVHPVVFEDIKSWSLKCGVDIVALETALLLESGLVDLVDIVVTVTAPYDLRVQRASLRDNVTRQQIVNRINAQSTQEELLKYTHYVVDNSEGIALLPQIDKIITDIKTKL